MRYIIGYSIVGSGRGKNLIAMNCSTPAVSKLQLIIPEA